MKKIVVMIALAAIAALTVCAVIRWEEYRDIRQRLEHSKFYGEDAALGKRMIRCLEEAKSWNNPNFDWIVCMRDMEWGIRDISIDMSCWSGLYLNEIVDKPSYGNDPTKTLEDYRHRLKLTKEEVKNPFGDLSGYRDPKGFKEKIEKQFWKESLERRARIRYMINQLRLRLVGNDMCKLFHPLWYATPKQWREKYDERYLFLEKSNLGMDLDSLEGYDIGDDGRLKVK